MVGRPQPLPLRGREDELESIRRRLLDVREGTGGIVLIEGSAGLGKTRLMEAVTEIGTDLSFRVGRGATEVEPEGRGIYRVPRVEALLAAPSDGDPPLVPRSALTELRASPELLFWLLQDLQSVIEKAALQHPLLLCLDDLHNAGTTCASTMRDLPLRLSSLPVAWVVTYRPDDGAQQHQEAMRTLADAGAEVIRLGPLSHD